MPIPHLSTVREKPKQPYKETPKTSRLFDIETVPTVYPTKEEFGNPVDYVASLKTLGDKYGMVKVVPPSTWSPKFSLDIGRFDFDCRGQTLSRLNAENRVAYEWLDRLEKYHKVYHRPLEQEDKFPTVDGKTLNLYTVKLLRDRSVGWYEVCNKLGIHPDNLPVVVRFYSNTVWPFDRFVQQQTARLNRKRTSFTSVANSEAKRVKVERSSGSLSPVDSLLSGDDDEDSYSAKDLFDHAGLNDDTDSSEVHSPSSSNDDVAMCPECEAAVDEGSKYCYCEDCKEYYHFSCLGEWPRNVETYICTRCLIQPSKFYFEAGNNYTLPEFQDMANEMREKYVPEALEDADKIDQAETLVERIFWDNVNDLKSSLSVEYGADIQCDVKGSGFPTIGRDANGKYVRHPWNLNNFPQMKSSLFRHIKTDYSGVTLPWAYVGMIFSAFCWHAEDHYTYSINYQFFGDTKTWYAIPGEYADKFEQMCKNLFPDVFKVQPQLLHERSTMVSPELIRKHGIPCYAVDQRPGQFIVTFPKAYHAGFNHGFNYNEAVNFAPPDWVPYGREAVESYKLQHHAPIFSHEMLLLKVALHDRSVATAQWLLPYLRDMINEEAARVAVTIKMHKFHEIELKITNYAADFSDESDYTCQVCNSLAYLSRLKVAGTTYCHEHVPFNSTYKGSLKQQGSTAGKWTEVVLVQRYTIEQLGKIYQEVSERLGRVETAV